MHTNPIMRVLIAIALYTFILHINRKAKHDSKAGLSMTARPGIKTRLWHKRKSGKDEELHRMKKLEEQVAALRTHNIRQDPGVP